MRHLLVGLASAALASACAWPYGYCLRTPEEWKGWSEASFAHVEIHASRVDGLEPRGFDAALARLLGAAVGHSDWKYGAIYWANLDAPREFDLAALHELLREWGTRGVRYPQVYLFADWVFAGDRATLEDTGQTFPIDWSPGDGRDRYALLVTWPIGGGEPVLTPSW